MKLASTLAIGTAACVASGVMGAVIAVHLLVARPAPVAVAHPATRAPTAGPAEKPSAEAPSLGDREKAVLARLAQLPDLPVTREPTFDLPAAQPSGKPEPAKSGAVNKSPPKAASEGKALLVQIEVISIENGRIFYRAVDGITHVAKSGERLLGVNGRVISVRKDEADLQINGEKLTVSATNI